MTLAKQAARTHEGSRVLRIAVVQGARIVEERVLRERGPVTVGRTERNTFTLAGDALPPSFELFAVVDGGYVLHFVEGMEGRLVLAEGVRSLAELRASGRARRMGSIWQLPLDESSRGKVTVGDATFLFQFVVPPPTMPRPQLPVAIRTSPLERIDWRYNACLASFLMLAFGGISYVEYVYDPQVVEGAFDLHARVTQLIPPPMPEPVPAVNNPVQQRDPEQPTGTPEPDTPTTPDPRTPDHGQPRPAPRPSPRRSDEEIIAEVMTIATRAGDAVIRGLERSAEFVAITGATDTGRGTAADVFHRGGLMNGSVQGLAATNGITNGNNTAGITRTGLVASTAGPGNGPHGLGRDHVVRPSGNDIASTATLIVRVPTGRAQLDPIPEPSGPGALPISVVGDVIRRNIGGIQNCYTQALRTNPSLRGRIEVDFTIGTSGRITGTPAASGMSEAPEVGRCVAQRLRYLVFPAPRDGAVDFSIPFNFTPGQ
jgi:hypothetical protein